MRLRLIRNLRFRCRCMRDIRKTLRMYDQHFICSGPVGALKHSMVDDIRMPLTEWTRRHNQWADAEVRELRMKRANAEIQGRWFGNKIQVKRKLRQCYENLPLFVRPGVLFSIGISWRVGFSMAARDLSSACFRLSGSASLSMPSYSRPRGRAPEGN